MTDERTIAQLTLIATLIYDISNMTGKLTKEVISLGDLDLLIISKQLCEVGQNFCTRLSAVGDEHFFNLDNANDKH